jgi:hypothetical protein
LTMWGIRLKGIGIIIIWQSSGSPALFQLYAKLVSFSGKVYYIYIYIYIFIDMDVRANLYAPRLILQALKLTII